jgi:hypothetical protein
MSKDNASSPPQISPYVFPFLLAGMGLWCFYDGWISSDPEMQEYILFNRVGSVVLLLWAVADFFRTRKLEKQEQESESSDQAGS